MNRMTINGKEIVLPETATTAAEIERVINAAAPEANIRVLGTEEAEKARRAHATAASASAAERKQCLDEIDGAIAEARKAHPEFTTRELQIIGQALDVWRSLATGESYLD